MKKKILILASNPKGDLRIDREIHDLQEAIQRSPNSARFDVPLRMVLNQSDLRRYILDVKPQIIHFCGHGEKEGLVLEDGRGTAKIVSNAFIVDLLSKFADRIECVLLNACDTEPLADEIVKHLNYAIGMNRSVFDAAAIAFTEGFYDALGAGESIESAFEIGKNAVLGRVSTHDAEQRKLTAIDDNNNPIEIENREHLIPVLKQNPQPTLIKQIWLSSEQERKAVRELLVAIEDNSNKIPLFHTTELIILKDQYIPVQVTLERRYKHTVETTWGYAESEAELRRIYALKGSGEEEIKRQQVDWQEAKRQESRIVVLADPGMGKSTLLGMEVCTTVEQSCQALDNGQTLKGIVIPLYIKLSRLADEIRKMPILEAILEIVQVQHRNLLIDNENAEIKAFLNDFLKEQLFAGKCLLLLDALDEVPQKKRHQLLEKLNNFARNYPSCKIIGTSRIVGYGGKLVDGAKDIEIVPFTQQQTEQYIETWFTNAQNSLKDKSVTSRGLIQALRDRPQIGGLAQNPLLLSLICSLYQRDQLKLPARRGDIYQQSVDYMLDEWSHDNQRLSSDDAQIDSKKELLEELAYQFSCQETDVVSLRQLRHQIKDYLRRDNATDLNDKTNRLIEELSEQDGILQKLNPDEDRYLFLHRTFQEYFAASYLNYMIEDDRTEGIALLRRYFWNYDWHETLILLADLMDQPMVLIKEIASTRDDIFNTQLLLAGRCIAECSELSEPLINETIDRIYQFWLKYPDLEFVRSVVVAVAQTYAQLVQNLKTALQHENSAVVKNAVWALGNIGNDKAVDALIPALQHRNLEVRWIAAMALGNIGNDKAVDTLIMALHGEKNSDIVTYAARALGNIGNDKAVNALIATLQDKDSEARPNAAWALGNIGNEQAVDALIEALHDEKNLGDLIRYAAEALGKLGKIGNERAVNALIEALQDENFYVRGNAIEALGKLGKIGNKKVVDALIATLQDKNSEARLNAVWALGNIGNNKAVNALIKVLQDEDSDVRWNATRSLEEIGNDKAVDALIAVLQDQESDVISDAAWALGNIGNERAVDALIDVLQDKNFYVRANAAEALGKIGNEQAVDTLIAVLQDKESTVRANAAKALGKIGSNKAVDVLIETLQNDDSEARLNAAEALGNVGNERAVDPLIKILQDTESNVRKNAAEAVGKIGSNKAVDILIETLQDGDSEVRRGVAKALGKIGNDKAVDALIMALQDKESEVRANAAEALGNIGNEQAVIALIETLQDKELEVRANTAEALGKIGNERAVVTLIETLQDEDFYVSENAAMALVNISNNKAVDTLIMALQYGKKSDIVVTCVARALGNIGNEKAVDTLIMALQYEDLAIRGYVAEALDNISSPACLEKLLQSAKMNQININRSDIFRLARSWAIRFSKQGLPFIPVYPVLVGEAETSDRDRGEK